MDQLFLVSRILFGGYFLMSGFNHFRKGAMLSGYAGSKGVPMPKFAVYATGILLLFGGAGILLGVYVRLAAFALALFLAPVSFKMHAFWSVSDPNMKMMEQVNFMKNLALLGASLAYLFIPQPWEFSLF